jgi:hypothetical protein
VNLVAGNYVRIIVQVIQHFTEQGERKAAIESLLDVLEVRFQSSEVQTLNPIIESIEELPYLRELLREAVQVSSLDETLMNSGVS